MLFNSPDFLFLFLPAAVVLHFALARWSMNAAIAGTILASLAFYAWWNPPFVVLPVASILVNFWLARRMIAAEEKTARAILIAGIAANLLVLCHFKYSDFLLSIVDGHKAAPPNVPLALSFTTFVQIAFLVHVHRNRTRMPFNQYALFVAFFPHLIAGPIVRWGSLGRQIGDASRYRVDWDNVALGLTILVLGLVKKVLIADPLAPHVAGVFDAAARGDPLTAFAAWAATFAYVAEIYFDFSGYSDMAIGLGLLFNFRLPINFAAPLRAVNISDLWRRWHITLSRLARDLVYIPLGGNRAGRLRQARNVMLTMVLIGIWHGAGWTFVAWGAFNGALLVVLQAWRALVGPGRGTAAGRLAGWALTFTAFSAGFVFFRAADMQAAWHLIAAMFGFGAPVTATAIVMEWDGWLIGHDYLSGPFVLRWLGDAWSVVGTLWTAVALLIAWLVPDTMEITGYREDDADSNWRRPIGIFAWQPSLVSLAAVAAMFLAVFTSLGRVSEFLYYQF